jgi:hypothetical protein
MTLWTAIRGDMRVFRFLYAWEEASHNIVAYQAVGDSRKHRNYYEKGTFL